MSQLQVNNITDTGGSTLLGRRNAIINGNFDVWQRGTSQTVSGYGSADRWNLSGSTSTWAITQQSFTVGQTDVPHNPKYYYRNVVTTGSTAGSYTLMTHAVEDVRTFAGETVTLSFYAKADASKNVAVELAQNFGTGGSPSAQVTTAPETISLTTSWAKYTVTVALPSLSGKTLGTNDDHKLGVYIWLDAGSDYNARTNSLGNQSGTFEFAQVQLEAGSVATPFERRSYGEELALCQRYYEACGGSSDEQVAVAYSTSSLRGQYSEFTVQKRTSPTMLMQRTEGGASNLIQVYQGGSYSDKTGSFNGVDPRGFTSNTGTGTYTAGDSYITLFYWEADAEL